MAFATIDEIGFDDDGNVSGVQFDGRARRIQEWREKREEQEFRKLVARLQSRNCAREARQDPVRRSRIAAAQIRHRKTQKYRDTMRRRRVGAYEKNPTVNVCEQCGAMWIPPYEQRVKRSRFCNRRCRNRWHGERRDRSRGLVNRGLQSQLLRDLRENGSGTAAAIADRLGLKLHTVRVVLCRLSQCGRVASDGRRPATYAALPVDEENRELV